MRQPTTAAALRRRYPLLAFRLWRVWVRGRRERDRAVLAALRAGDPHLRRVTVRGRVLRVAELEFADGRLVRLAQVHPPAAVALDRACQRGPVELAEAAHPGPVWALYFRVNPPAGGGPGLPARRPLLGRTAVVGWSQGGRPVPAYA